MACFLWSLLSLLNSASCGLTPNLGTERLEYRQKQTPITTCTLTLIIDNAGKVVDSKLGLVAVLGWHVVGIELVL